MVWVVSRFRLKAPPGTSSPYISPLTPSGQRNCASRASQPQKSVTLPPQPGGGPRKFVWTCGGIRKKQKNKKLLPLNEDSQIDKCQQKHFSFAMRTAPFLNIQVFRMMMIRKYLLTFRRRRLPPSSAQSKKSKLPGRNDCIMQTKYWLEDYSSSAYASYSSWANTTMGEESSSETSVTTNLHGSISLKTWIIHAIAVKISNLRRPFLFARPTK